MNSFFYKNKKNGCNLKNFEGFSFQVGYSEFEEKVEEAKETI